ncbi:MAG TPA: hypothetical protein VFR86_26925 [Burkholderiaceae bacterium]|nr:hypothetical protein [Burkholderiaceae bacterium]
MQKAKASTTVRNSWKYLLVEGFWTHPTGRSSDLRDVVNHYDADFELKLSEQEKRDLIDYLKSV